MHLSNKHRRMNQTFTIMANEYCNFDPNTDQSKSDSRFRTFTKCKIREQSSTVIVNRYQQRYFDSPTMITFDDDNDDHEIPVVRCAKKASILPSAEPSLDESDLTDLLVFTNPNRALSESMQVIISRHPSLEDMKYVNDVSSVLLNPPLLMEDKEEHIYQELIRVDQSMKRSSPDVIDENKENRPPLMPILGSISRIPIRTPPPPPGKTNPTPISSDARKKTDEIRKKTTPKSKTSLTDILNEWSTLTPQLKELLSKTRKMPLRIANFSSTSSEFRRLKQLLNDFELTMSSWTDAMNQCRCVLQHAQQQNSR